MDLLMLWANLEASVAISLVAIHSKISLKKEVMMLMAFKETPVCSEVDLLRQHALLSFLRNGLGGLT